MTSHEELRILAKSVLEETQNEANLQRKLHNLLEALWGTETVSAQMTLGEGGQPDLISRQRKVILEIKSPDSLSNRESVRFKTGFEQLVNYLIQVSEENQSLERWEAVLTDGTQWYSWCWEKGREREQQSEKLVSPEHLLLVLGDLGYKALSSQTGAPPPQNIWKQFSQFDNSLTKDIWPICQNDDTENKFGLWSDILRGSGMDETNPEKKRALFRRHTFLACFVKMIRAQLTGDDRDVEYLLGEGYWSWAVDSQQGKTWARNLRSRINRYDWALGETDVLRNLYLDAIDEQQRYTFGEYYTPDWVCQAIAEKVLDEDWIASSIAKALEGETDGIGVLDPACGSGSFLFHAAKKIGSHRLLEPYKPSRRAKVIASLINGIDVHPVAVEIAQVTLLRALPADPGVRLNVWQGDSLALKQFGPSEPSEEVLMPLWRWDVGNHYIELPREFVEYSDFSDLLEEFVRTGYSDQKLPKYPQFDLPTMEVLEQQHENVKKIIKEKGDSVWAWFILNTVSPKLLAQRKVDRIIANPPWVAMKSIDDADRQSVLQDEAKRLNLWKGGQLATSFDIASIFVIKCESLYLKGSDSKDYITGKAAWVVPATSLSSSQWEPAKAQYQEHRSNFWDLSQIKEAPFTIPSAIWFRNIDQDSYSVKFKNRKTRDSYTWSLDDVEFLEPRYVLGDFDPTGINYPLYLDTRGKPLFRQGATLTPSVLVRIQDSEPVNSHFSQVTTVRSTQDKWRELEPMEGVVPNEWIQEVILPNNILPFCRNSKPSYSIIPSSEGQLIASPEGIKYWTEAESEWRRNKGSGKVTPELLTQQINYQNKISSQLGVDKSRILYNRSGGRLRAAVIEDATPIVDSAFYWMALNDVREGYYLVGILNSEILQPTLSNCQKSDRDYHQHFWRKIPIPRFDDGIKLHISIAQLSTEGIEISQQIRDQVDPDGVLSQQRVSKDILQQLSTLSIMDRLNQMIAELLPDFV